MNHRLKQAAFRCGSDVSPGEPRTGVRNGRINAVAPGSNKRVRLAALLLLLGASSAFAQAGKLPGASVDSLLELVRQNNPDLAAARHEAVAAAERVYTAGAMPDPRIERELEIDNLADSGGHDTTAPFDPFNPFAPVEATNLSRGGSVKFRFVQEVPFWGKRDLRRDVASALADEARGRAEAMWVDLSARIKTAYAQYYLAVGSAVLTREILDLYGTLESTSRARYNSGLALQQDVIRAQEEQTNTRNDLVAIETERQRLHSRINALVRRPPNAPLAAPERLRAIPVPAKLDYAALEERLKLRNPQLFIDEAGISAADKNRDLTYRNRWPDGSIGTTVIYANQKLQLWGLYWILQIPLQQERRRSQEREAEAQLSAARERWESTQIRLLSELSENLSALEGARRTEHLLSANLLPQNEDRLKSARATYEAGRTDFAALIDALRAIWKTKLDLLKARVETQVRLAEIERLVGDDL